ncbi:MAG TPA: pyrroline-5-carboxylate reductase [bacterium]|nr:pyrroline-5-carboxylate reductase [bacterium]
MLANRTVGIIGAGNMAEALLRGAFDAGVLRPACCVVTNKSNDERLARLARTWAVRTTRDKAELMAASEVVILAVKPGDVPTVLGEIAPHVTPRHLVVSVAAGVPIEMIEQALGAVPVVRAMPNTSTAVRASATAIASGRLAGSEHLAVARAIFEAVGWVGVVSESLLDVVTAVSGSGPAYVYALAEAMVDGGERAGLPPDVARALVSQTILGAGKMLTETGESPEALRGQVTSPGGTTVAGLEALEQGGFRAAVHAAVTRATRRARELGGRPIRAPR